MMKEFHSFSLFALIVLFCFSITQGAKLNARVLNYDHPQFHEFPSSHVTSRDESLRISFSAFGERFDFNLKLNYELVKDAVFIRYDSENKPTEIPAPMIAYFSKVGDTRLTLFDIEDRLFEGYTHQNGEHYLFVPASQEEMSEEIRATLSSNMLVIKMSDLVEDEDNPRYCGVRDPHSNEGHLHKFSTRDYTPAQTDPLPAPPCPSTQKKLLIGIVTDRSYETTYASTESAIVSQMNSISGIYVRDANLQMGVGHVHIGLTESFTTGCEDVNTKLARVSQWRGNGIAKDNTEGLYGVFTTCYKSGTVGLAWVGVVCTRKSNTMSDGTYWSGTSVSSIVSTGGYLVAAHEMGHNYGSSHDNSGGIMYPSTTGATGFSINSQKAICDGYLSQASDTTCFINTTCAADCTGKQCGADGCGGDCGTCSTGLVCSSGSCIAPCTPQCNGLQCGANGCGGTCGTCTSGACSNGVCVTSGGGTSGDKDLYTTLHNDLRNKYNLTPYQWSDTLFDSVYSWVERCEWGYYESTYSSSILAWSGSVSDPGPMISSWLNQENNWNCETDGCVGRCSEFRRMIWDDTQRFACHKKVCDSSTGVAPGTWTGPWSYLICVYDPYNGWVGERPIPTEQCPNYCTSTDTCSSKKFTCGTFIDNCNREVDCGGCSTSTVCENNNCVCVPSKTCLSVECGPIDDDGCGGSSDCGSCGQGQQCSNGVCVCQPSKTCQNQDLECGTLSDDGCGNSISCGGCGEGSVCENGVCTTPCQPNATCQDKGFNCGELDDGCGTVTCGTCSGNDSCMEGVCTCQPVTSCQELSKNCGTINDGCNDVQCGTCTESFQCRDGACVGCSGCHEMASCNDNLECVCDPGWTGDGYTCEPVQDTPEPNPNGPGNWATVEGVDWLVSGSVLQNLGTSTSDSTVEWTDVKNMPPESGRSFSVLAQRLPGNKNLGIAFNVQPNTMYFIRWQSDGTTSTGGEWKLGLKINQGYGSTTYPYNTYLYSFRSSSGSTVKFSKSFPLNTWVLLTLELYSTSFNIKVDNNWSLKINMGSSLDVSGLGVTTNGPSFWQNATFVSTTQVVISLVSCTSEEVLRQQIANALRVDPSTIGDIEVFCAKRQSAATASIVFNSVPGGPNSAALASRFNMMISSGNRGIHGSGIKSYSSSYQPIENPSNAEAVSVSESSSSGESGSGGSNVGTEVIVPIVVIAGIVILGVIAAAFFMKKKSDDEHIEMTPVENRGERKSRGQNKGDDNILFQAPTQAPEPGALPSGVSGADDPSKPRAAVDVMGREEATSITARAPAHPKDFYNPE